MWQMGYPNPADYQDNEGFCGGVEVQWGVNGGNCGVCGDRYDDAVKEHEAPGGRFASSEDWDQNQYICLGMPTVSLSENIRQEMP